MEKVISCKQELKNNLNLIINVYILGFKFKSNQYLVTPSRRGLMDKAPAS